MSSQKIWIFSLLLILLILPFTAKGGNAVNTSAQCIVNKEFLREQPVHASAGCLILIKRQVLMIHDVMNSSLPWGKPEQAEGARLTACRNTLEKVFGIRNNRGYKVNVGELFYADKKFVIYRCNLNEPALNYVYNQEPYQVIDGNFGRSGVINVSLDNPQKDSRVLWQYTDLRKEVMKLLE